MMQLLHMPFSPFSRKVRLALAEKRLDVELIDQLPWEMGDEIFDVNPAGMLPVLKDGELVLTESTPILEYLEDVYPQVALLPRDAGARAEVRRLMAWFDLKFHNEVGVNVTYEKIHRRLRGEGYPDIAPIRAGLINLRTHLDYISHLANERHWLAGRDLTLADFSAAAHLSCLDYVGDVPWSNYPDAKEWYVRVKSRPAFRLLLEDRIRGVPPSRHYADLDF
jgi:glutathione S-transferase